jgi:uncharacterized membrane protein
MTDGKDHHVHLGQDERALLVQLRAKRRHQREQAAQAGPPLSRGQQIADSVAATMGSWPFIIIQTTILAAWITLNIVAWIQHWDPYPFILLNLALSFQAAYAAPFIMMSQNRQQDIDRSQAAEDFRVNVKAELEIELLHQKLDQLREQEVVQLSLAVKELSELLNRSGMCEPKQGGATPRKSRAPVPKKSASGS